VPLGDGMQIVETRHEKPLLLTDTRLFATKFSNASGYVLDALR